MKFLIVVAALVAVASAQYADFGTIVKGPKTILAGPSGVIHADAGTIVKDPKTILAAPAVVPRLVDTSIWAPRLVHAPLIDTLGWGGRSLVVPGHTRLFL